MNNFEKLNGKDDLLIEMMREGCTVITENQFQSVHLYNLYLLQALYPSQITNGFTAYQWDNIVLPWLNTQHIVEMNNQLSTSLQTISDITDPIILNSFAVYPESYFVSCNPTNCQRTLTNTVRDQLLASLSFAGGLLPLYTVILTIFYTITAKCCRNVLKPLYRDIHFKDQTGSDVELKTPTSGDV